MRGATPELLSLLQRNPANIRNICILAHVDHGKTTLADALVASNGIISQRMAGKLRYMDSREDEQIRGITMKSSAISLIYNYSKDEYLINLIDSPGHVDFSSEVSTAVRLCEGAIVVVDVVEGVCPQTHAVLRQAFLENIKPVLVLNKIDRLIVELKMEPMEAFYHLQQILEQVNLVTNELFTVEAMEKSAVEVDDNGGNMSQIHEWTTDEDEENRNIYFCPDQGNVIFSSAYDGWGFSISDFAVLYASKLGINQEVLKRTLWGDFYLNTKTKRIMKGAQIKGKKPLFVQFILENLWSVYDTIYVRRDKEKTEKIITSLGLKILPRDMRHSDSRVQLQAVCSQWLPVSDAVLRVVVSKLPSPLAMSEERVEKLMCSHMRKFESLPSETQSLKQSFLTCSASEESPVIVFVSKMLPVDKKLLPQNKQRPLTAAEAAERRRKAREKMAEKLATQNKEQTTTEANTLHGESYEISLPENDTDSEEKGPDFVFIAFARVFSGTVRKGQKLYVLGPKHDPALISRKLQSGEEIKEATSIQELSHDDHVTCVTIKDLFVLMGRELEEMDHIPAGNILGIRGLEDHILKSATVSSSLMCPTFCDLYFDAAPIVRVAIEPIHTRDMQNLVTGLKLLNQADPCVQVLVQETGEHVIITAGEVHLQRCVEDIKERYAKIDINVSSPIVPFRETIVPPPKLDMVNEAISDRRQVLNKKDSEDEEVIEVGLVEVTTINRRCTLRIRAVPLPDDITRLLEENQNLIKTMGQISKSQGKGKGWLEVHQNVIDSIREFKCQLNKVFKGSGKMWRDAENQMWSFGPKRVGPNVLLNRVKGYDRANVWDCVETKQQELKLRQYDNSIISGFQIATLAGPLCEEPLRGVCFIIEEWDYIRSSNSISYDEDVQKLEVTDLNSCDNTMSESPSDVVSSETVQDGDDTESETKSSDSESEPSEQRQRMGHSHMSGQLIYCVKAACRKAFQTQPQRLMVAMYKCNIQATAEVLGKLCGVLGKRYGRVIEDTMKEGSQIFNIKAVLPVVESFGFTEDMRKKTSGLASPQLVFSHWEVVDVDPFWVPTTEEEYAHFGEKADSDNRALHYMNQVRKRKGLKVDEKIVEHAEKQRTLTKMK